MRITLAVLVSLCSLFPASDLQAQRVTTGVSLLSTDREDMPGGPGVFVRYSWEVLSLVRLEARLGRDWGRSSGTESMCSSYWPEPAACVMEDVERRHTATGIEGTMAIVSPSLAGFRFGIGGGLAAYDFDVSRAGSISGRVQRPAPGYERPGPAPTALLLAEYSGAPLPRLSLELRAQRTAFDFGGCVMDSWAICETETQQRLSVGASYRF